MNPESPSILIVGAGAIGALYGSALARSGARVSRRVPLGLRAGAARRLSNHAASCSAITSFGHTRCYAVLLPAQTPPDYLILTVKVLPDVDRAALIRPAVGPKTVIVLIQNGIDIEAEIAAAFPTMNC